MVGEEAYCAAGGTFTTDLFGERRYCDDAGLVMDLVQDRLDAIATAAREDGWRDAEGQLYRPDSYWIRGTLAPAGALHSTVAETPTPDPAEPPGGERGVEKC